MTVMLTFGLALGSLGYKQQVLASAAADSQHAFYAADAALECALYADQKLDFFAYSAPEPASAPAMTCDGMAATATKISWSAAPDEWVIGERVSLDSGTLCADVTIYKPASGAAAGTTYLFSQGYNTSCANVAAPNGARIITRGLNARY